MFSCPPLINKDKDLENSNSNFWRVRCRETVIGYLEDPFSEKKMPEFCSLEPIQEVNKNQLPKQT